MASWQGNSNPVPILEKIYRDLHDIKLHLMPSYAEREGAAAAAPAAAAAAGAGAAAVRPLKMLSPEHKAKMLEAAAAAREAKKAEKEGSAPAAAAPPSAPSPAEEEPEEWIRRTISGKKHLWNPASSHCYRCEADGSQGAWAGLYNPKTQKIDDSVPEPEHNGGSRKQKSTRRRSTKSRKTRRN